MTTPMRSHARGPASTTAIDNSSGSKWISDSGHQVMRAWEG
jgi:hypothetical protein